MSFTDEERRQWLDDRRSGRHAADAAPEQPVCGHCGNAFPHGSGVVTDDFSICDVCNDD